MLEERQSEFETIEEISLKIAEIDEKINLQLNEILHHSEFKSIEAIWRGLHYLVNQGAAGLKVKVKILNSGKMELLKSFERALELKESPIYKKVYTEVYEEGWQIPFGLLVGAFEFGHDPQDVAVLEYLSEVSAAAHAPFVSGVSPSMFERENFAGLAETPDVSEIFEAPEFMRWNNFRKSGKSRYVGLCLPYISLRAPFEAAKDFDFKETIEKPHQLGGNNAAFAFAGCVVRAYGEKSWLGKMRGTGTDGEVGGLSFRSTVQDRNGESRHTALDARLENKFAELTRLGFMTLIEDSSGTPCFFNTQSVFEPPIYDSEAANTAARLHAQLENLLAASRFAHYLMSLWRERAHLFNSRDDKRNLLNKWLWRYYHESDTFDVDDPRCLVREFYADLSEIPGKPGQYKCILFIRPVYQLDDMPVAMRLEVSLYSQITGF